jgi:hypothetical protein
MTGLPRGFGFVTFRDAQIADSVVQAVHTVDGKEVSNLIKYQIAMPITNWLYFHKTRIFLRSMLSIPRARGVEV